MARLYLVRHAQASFGGENYDLLSEQGLKQSAYIPQHFSFDTPPVLYRGDMVRQQQTADIAFPGVETRINKGLNEFDHMNVLSVYQPLILDREKMMVMIMDQKDPRKFLTDEFGRAILTWTGEEGETAYKESFRDFRTRVLGALTDMSQTARQERHKDVVAITSGGVISLIVQHLLELSYSKMIDLNLVTANTSVTCLLFNDDKITLNYYNNFSHLPHDMVTVM